MDGSLYERLGGVDAITAVVGAVVDLQMKDDRINQKFARTNVDRLTKEFVDLICQATGGPCTYTGRDMTEAHLNMGVASGEFQAFARRSLYHNGRPSPIASRQALLDIHLPDDEGSRGGRWAGRVS